MAIVFDNGFYNENIVDNHDNLMSMNASWVDHYNFMASIPWNTEADNAMFIQEMKEYLCYDV